MSPTKVAVAGEGGLVATNDAELAQAIRLGRDYGNPGNYDCQFPGLNSRMSELHAAVGLASLDGLDDRIAHRNDLVTTFKHRAADIPGLTYQVVRSEDVSTFKDLTLIIEPESLWALRSRPWSRAGRRTDRQPQILLSADTPTESICVLATAP